jgi:hypothetical protein
MISAIIIEIFDEAELLKIMEAAISLEVKVIRKFRIFLVFLEGLQWIKLRLYSRYRIQTILNFLFKKLHIVICELKQRRISKDK